MRGVVSAGMVTALQYLGLRDVFDAVYGCSAGAINGAYFLAHQAPYGTTIYYEDINNENFISLRRAIFGQPAVSLEFLLDEIATKTKVLDWKAVLDSPVPLKVVVSSITEHRSVLLENFESRQELFCALKASARIPLLAGHPIALRGHELLDGSIYEAIPYHSALADGCSHLLVLLTRPPGAQSGFKWSFINSMISNRLRKVDPLIAEAFRRRSVVYRRDVAAVNKAQAGGESTYHILPICPGSHSSVHQLEKRRWRLLSGANAGASAVFDALQNDKISLTEIIAPFTALGHKFGSP